MFISDVPVSQSIEMEGDIDFQSLPEGCISHVIAHTSPCDACRSSLVSTTFRSAAASDTVWERFLPADCDEILLRAVEPVEFVSKRDLYFRLCDNILLDGGKKSFTLEKSSGRKCYMLSARELGIIWGDTPHYWQWICLPESRFSEVAELLDVCWLEIHGRIDTKMLSPRTTYAAYFIFKLGEGSWGLAFPTQETLVKLGTHESRKTVQLQPDGNQPRRSTRRLGRFLNWRGKIRVGERAAEAREDGWMELEMGEFYNEEGGDGEVDLSLLEVKGGHWKRGLIVEGIEVRPKRGN